MPVDRQELGKKLVRCREQFLLTVEEVAESTSIDHARLAAYEEGAEEPSGDDILILADFYKVDFKFFISNAREAPFEQTESLFRRLGSRLTKADRWAIQEFLYLCECEEQLMDLLGTSPKSFEFAPKGTFFKGHGKEAAAALRAHLGYGPTQVGGDVFGDFRRIHVHIFRRELENSEISGVCVRHPIAGLCLLVNFSEDVYRQRFTAAHEAAHAVLDGAEEFVVDGDVEAVGATRKWNDKDLIEIRANSFASHYLLPPSVLASLPTPASWTDPQAVDWAHRLRVNPQTLSYGLAEAGLIDQPTKVRFAALRVPKAQKSDPELPPSLTAKQVERREKLLRRGLSVSYTALAFDAFERGLISLGRLAEMLLVSERELVAVAEGFGRKLVRGDHS